jgi:ribosomal protein S4E
MDQEGSNEASANLNDSVNTFDTNVSVKLEMPEQEIDDTIEYNDWDNENPE